jgi:hypothetical protein
MKLTVTKREWLSKIFGAVFCLALLANPAKTFSATPSASYNLTLAWSRNSSRSPEVAGYRVYYGTTSKKYTDNIAVGNVATYVVSGLTAGVPYFFAITAYNTNGLESLLSKEFRYVLKSPKVPKTPPSQPVNLPGKTGVVPVSPAMQIPAASIRSSDMAATVTVLPPVQIRMTSNNQLVLTVSGQIGHTYYVMATQTLADWTVIGTVTLGASGSQDFTDTNTANLSQRYYRISDTQP